MPVLFLPLLFLAAAVLSCSREPRGQPAENPGPAGPLQIRVERVWTDRTRIAPNPVTGDETPEECQRGFFFRYRLDPGQAVRAILLLLPGGSTGANNFDYLARELIRMSNGGVEVWVCERRPNLLEDLAGMEAAEAAGDIEIALDYYYRGRELNGRSFAGFLAQEEAPFLSEWGLELLMQDVQAAVELVPEPRRRTNLFIAGHSLGVVHVLDYLGWDFDGRAATTEDAGYNQVAGAVLLDAPILAQPPSLTRGEYLGKVDRIRDGRSDRYAGFFPELTPGLFAFGEVLGMAAHPRFDNPRNPEDGPEGISRLQELPLGPDVASFLDLLFSDSLLDAWFDLPPTRRDFQVTNEALLGMLFDDNFQIITPFHLSLGFVSPPEKTRPRDFPALEPLVSSGFALSDPGTRYGWLDYDQVGGIEQTSAGEEVTELARLAEAMWRGPTNYGEWYFSTRLLADQSAAGMLSNLEDRDWQSRDFGLNLFHTAGIDVPILCIGADGGMAREPAAVDAVARSVSQTTRDGIPRSSEEAFKVTIAPGYGHFDVLLADNAAAGGNAVFGEILDFVRQHSRGEVQVP